MKKTESNIQREIMLAASDAGMSIWRNNVGRGWQGEFKDVSGWTLIEPSGKRYYIPRGALLTNHRPIDFGLCPGSSDLIGLRPVIIAEDLLGETIAQFVAIECKSNGGRASSAQKTFLQHVDHAGGVACLARSAEDIKR